MDLSLDTRYSETASDSSLLRCLLEGYTWISHEEHVRICALTSDLNPGGNPEILNQRIWQVFNMMLEDLPSPFELDFGSTHTYKYLGGML